jgi:hypothetical protein
MPWLPANPKPASVEIVSTAPTLHSYDSALTRNVRDFDHQRWYLRVKWPALSRADWATVFGFLAAQQGQFRTFEFMPPGIDRRGTGTGTPYVDGGGQTGDDVDTAGWSASQSNILRAGDLIRIDQKVYAVTADASSDVSGLSTLLIEPKLVAPPADKAWITVDDVYFHVALADDEVESMYDYNSHYFVSADFIEVIE